MRRYRGIRFSNEWVFILDDIYKECHYDELEHSRYQKELIKDLERIAHRDMPKFWGIVTRIQNKLREVKDPNSIKHLKEYQKYFEGEYNALTDVMIGAQKLLEQYKKRVRR